MQVRVEVYNITNDEMVNEMVLDYNKNDDRVKLSKTIMWAVNNSHGVQVYNLKDEKADA